MPAVLRHRFYITILPLVVLLTGLTLYAAVLISSLGGDVEHNTVRYQELARAADLAKLSVANSQLGLNDLERGNATRGLRRLQNAQADFSEFTKRLLGGRNIPELTPTLERFQVVADGYRNTIYVLLLRSENGLIAPSSLPQAEEANDEIMTALIDLENALHLVAEADISALRSRTTLGIYILIGGLGVAAGLATVVSYQLRRSLLDPIEHLANRMEDLAESNFHGELRGLEANELGRIGRSFNTMLDRLQVYRSITNEKVMATSSALRTIIERSPHAFFFLNHSGEQVYRNHQAEELTSAKEFTDGFPAKLLEVLEAALATSKPSIATRFDQAIALRINGEERYFLPQIYPIDLPNTGESNFGESIKAALVLQDVSVLQLADKLKDNLVATVSHELKTPLTSARTCLHLLADQSLGELNEDQLDLVLTARDDIERQLAMIQNLLDLSRIQAGEQKLELADIPADELLRESARAHATMAEEAEVTLSLQPSPAQPVIHGDRSRLGIVLNNFVSNAIRYSPTGGTVILRVRVNGNRCRLSVIDQGPGVSAEFVQRAFEKFSQDNNPGARPGGAGLGLYISREIIEAHRGEIGCGPRSEGGSEFFFELTTAADE